MTHFNIQINIQKVEPPAAPTTRSTYRATGQDEDESPRGKRVTEVLSLKVTAEGEHEAFAKAATLLAASSPELKHQHRASCDDASGNHLCGYP